MFTWTVTKYKTNLRNGVGVRYEFVTHTFSTIMALAIILCEIICVNYDSVMAFFILFSASDLQRCSQSFHPSPASISRQNCDDRRHCEVLPITCYLHSDVNLTKFRIWSQTNPISGIYKSILLSTNWVRVMEDAGYSN